MGSVRIEKVQELIKQQASEIIMREVKDPRIGFVTVTKVDVSSDLHNAKLFVSILGSDKQIEDTWKGLNSSIAFIRRELAHRIRLKFIPEIKFFMDTSLEYSAHIQKLLIEVNKKEAQKEKEDEAAK